MSCYYVDRSPLDECSARAHFKKKNAPLNAAKRSKQRRYCLTAFGPTEMKIGHRSAPPLPTLATLVGQITPIYLNKCAAVTMSLNAGHDLAA
jgi:hypothetical protein